MKAYFFVVCLLISTLSFAQKTEKLLKDAIPIKEIKEDGLPKFPGYKSVDRGTMIPATEDAIRGYFIRKLNMNLGDFEKRTIVKLQIRFVVGVEGEVTTTDMECEHDAYIKEGERIVQDVLPKMEPANHKNKNVSTLYDFPLTFIANATKYIEEESDTSNKK